MIAKLISYHHKQSGTYQSLITVFGNLTSNGLSAISILLLTRSLKPELFAEFALGFALLVIINKLSDRGYSQALLKFIPKKLKLLSNKKIFIASTSAKIESTIFFAIVGPLFLFSIQSFTQYSPAPTLYVAFILNGANVFHEHLLAILQSKHQFASAVLAAITQSLVKIFLAFLSISLFPQNPTVAFIGFAAAPCTSVFLKHLFTQDFNFTYAKNLLTKHTEITNMAFHSLINITALALIDNVDIFFADSYLSDLETGLYGGITKIAMLVSLASYSLGSVLNPRVARYNTANNLQIYLKKAFVIFFLTMLGIFPAVFLSEYAITYTIGSDYVQALHELQLLIVAAFLMLATTPFVAIFFSLKEAQWYFSFAGLLQVIIVFVGNVFYTAEFGLEAMAWTRIIAKAVTLVLTLGILLFYLRKEKKLFSV